MKRKSPTELTMGGTRYAGTLETDWEDRMKFLTYLTSALFSLSFRLKKLLDSKTKWLVSFENPFKVVGRETSFQVDESGLPGISTMLIQMDKKLNYIHEDLGRIEPTASIIEHWQLKPESSREMVALMWGEFSSDSPIIGPPKWQTSVPHCSISIMPAASNVWGYRKGSVQLMVTLSDNSKIIMYVFSRAEGERVFGLISPYIPAGFLAGGYTKWGEYKGPPFKPGLLRLRRIDHYPQGVGKQLPDRRIYYPADTRATLP